MNLIAALSDTARETFYGIPTICLTATNDIHSADGLWRIFNYGYGDQVSVAATPRNGSLVGYLSPNHEDNLNLVTTLTNSGNPSNFFVKVDTRCERPSSNDIKMYPIPQEMERPELPFEIRDHNSYHFDPMRCGTFVGHQGCWFDMGLDNPYGPDMVLLPPEVVPRSECYNPFRRRKPKQRYTMIPEQVHRGYAWHPDDICPDYRVVCGSTAPPNLPSNINDDCAASTKRLIQLPMEPCDEKSPECTARMDVTRGRLPSWDDPDMKWVQVNVASTLCTAPTRMHARRILANRTTTTTYCGDDNMVLEQFHNNVPFRGTRDRINVTYWAGWFLVRDPHGVYQFFEREKTNNGILGEDVPLLFLRYNYRNRSEPFGRRINDRRRRTRPSVTTRRPVYLPSQRRRLHPPTTSILDDTLATSRLHDSSATNSHQEPPTTSGLDNSSATNRLLKQPTTSRPKDSSAKSQPDDSSTPWRRPLDPAAPTRVDYSSAASSRWSPSALMRANAAVAAAVLMARNVPAI